MARAVPELLCLQPVEERPFRAALRVIKSLGFSPGVKEFQTGYTNSGIALMDRIGTCFLRMIDVLIRV
jgi:hypothetical protein